MIQEGREIRRFLFGATRRPLSDSSAALPVVRIAEPEAATRSDNASPVLIVI
jgi:hypothetical protein